MDNAVLATPRKYGAPPFRVAVIHGGPGAPGEVAPVARELGTRYGVLEPFQTADSVYGQVEELADCLKTHGSPPQTLVGYSWGAWLAYLLAAQYPALVHKLLLVSSGPFEDHFATTILEKRLQHLEPAERKEAQGLLAAGATLNDAGLARMGALCALADAYDPETPEAFEEPLPCQADIFAKVWPEAAALRRSGVLLQYAKHIQCPTLAIHGEHDPHPVAGVLEPLSKHLGRFDCIVLPCCGHVPWRERQAKARFYRALFAAM
jgi:pimeloyl-ACP methyl ester carboxylesterase